MLESYPVLTLAPPLLAITLAVVTRKVLLSLGAGVLSAALLIAGLNPIDGARRALDAFVGVFWADGALNSLYVYILAFTLLLGVIAAFIMMSGGTGAFAEWAERRIRDRPRAMLLPAVLGLVIFIDDYFNALAVGQVSRPVTDQHRISRAKLTYIVDSTAAPVAVLVPFSSWGAYILGIFGPIVAASQLQTSSVQAFVTAAAANYYAIAAVVLVWLVVLLRLDIGRMRSEERRAIETGELFDPAEDVPGQLSADLPVHRPGSKRALVVPFVLLVAAVFVGIVWTGYAAAGSLSPIEILAATDVGLSLFVASVIGLAAALYYYVRHTRADDSFGTAALGRGFVEGGRSMAPAVAILLLAWMLGDLIGDLGTGDYLGGIVEGSALAPALLIPIIFLVAGGMAFATGTSWGSFGLLLPITGGIMNSIEAPELLLPALGAVLAGAVAGDHASPISDTTILSATGSGCNVITHVVTQLPYAGLAALSALLGYLTLAATGSTGLGLLATVVVLLGLAFAARVRAPPLDPAAVRGAGASAPSAAAEELD